MLLRKLSCYHTQTTLTGREKLLLPVNEPPPHAAFEEATATVAGVDAVVLAAAGVPAHFADQSRAQRFARGRTLGCESNTVTQGRSVSCIHVPCLCFAHVRTICTMSSVCMLKTHDSILLHPFGSENLI